MLSDKMRANCAEILLDTIQQQSCNDPSTMQQPTTAIHREWKKRKNCAYPRRFLINLHIYQPTWKGLQKKKKNQILFFTAATKKDKDGFDIDNSTKDFIMTNNSSR